MAKKITKKELTQPDPIQLTLAKITQFILDNKSRLYIVAAGAMVLLLLFAGWYLYQTNNEKNAQLLYSNAHLASQKNSLAGGQMDNNIIKLYQDVISQYPGTTAALMSYYRLGNHYYRMNDIEASIKAYQEYFKASPGDNEFTTLAYIGLGYCYESKKDFKAALESFEKAANTKSAFNFESLNHRNIARIYEELNNREKAVEYYQKALGKTMDPSFQQLIRRKISSLG